MTSVRVQFVLIFAQPIQLYWLSENQNPDKFSYSAAQLLSNALSFYRSQNVLCQSKYFEPGQKFDCIQCLFKNFCAGTKKNLLTFFFGKKCLRLPQYVNTYFVWHKKFGLAQNILGPVKGQGIRLLLTYIVQRHLSLLTIAFAGGMKSFLKKHFSF